MRTRAMFWAALFTCLLAAHFCHARVLWTEEALPLAAARQMLLGKALYRDVWFDKPPLVPLVYLLWAAQIGWLLRLSGAIYATACCYVAFLLGRSAVDERTGWWAALLLGWFLTFDTPSAVLPLAADLLMVLPHLLAVLFAVRKQALWSGVWAGVAFLCNVKGAIILLACTLFVWPAVPALIGGFVMPVAISAAVLFLVGAWPAYLDQVWIWPAIYAGSSHVAEPVRNGLLRTANWFGFHAALLVAACVALRRRMGGYIIWGILSLTGVTLGARFFPRYFFQLLPPLVLLGACGLASLHKWRRWAVIALLLIPLVRWGPRYPLLALNLQPNWPDLAMDRDSKAAAQRIGQIAKHGDTLYVWGYRPDIFVYSGLPAASRYLDSQAMTGVPADRHLTQWQPVRVGSTIAAREELARSQPTFIADGLSLYNPRLAPSEYPELRFWLDDYQEFARTGGTILYRRVVR